MGVETPEADPDGGNGWVGQSLKRKEDPRLITGRATYVEDIMLPGMLHAALVRSSEAHAKILSIDATAAREQPGVMAVFTGEDMADLAAPCPMVWVPPGVDVHVPEHWPLARGKVGYVGQAVAVVLATERVARVRRRRAGPRRVRPAAGHPRPRGRRSRTGRRSSTRTTAATRCSSGRSRAATPRRRSPARTS